MRLPPILTSPGLTTEQVGGGSSCPLVEQRPCSTICPFLPEFPLSTCHCGRSQPQQPFLRLCLEQSKGRQGPPWRRLRRGAEATGHSQPRKTPRADPLHRGGLYCVLGGATTEACSGQGVSVPLLRAALWLHQDWEVGQDWATNPPHLPPPRLTSGIVV